MMKKYLIFALVMLVGLLSASAQNQNSLWKTHFSYDKAPTAIEVGNPDIYALSDKKLFSYNPQTDQYKTYLNPVNNGDISFISYNNTTNSLLVAREDGGIDVLVSDTFYPLLTLKDLPAILDKTINSISVYGNFAYLSTNFGIVSVDMLKKELVKIAFLGRSVYSVAILDNNLYASTSEGLITIGSNANIEDIANWSNFELSSKYSGTDLIDANIRDLAVYQNKLYFLDPTQRNLYYLNDGIITRVFIGGGTSLSSKNGQLLSYRSNYLFYFTSATSYTSVGVSSLLCAAFDPNQNSYWISTSGNLLSKAIVNGSTISYSQSKLKPAGPLTNYAFNMSYTGGKIRVVGGGYYWNKFDYTGVLSEFDNTTSSWLNFSALSVKDFVSVIANPEKPDQRFVATWGAGLLRLEKTASTDFSVAALYAPSNSSLKDIFGKTGYVRVNGLDFDDKNRLWVGNSEVSTVVNVFEQQAGTNNWTSQSLYYSDIDNGLTSVIYGLLVDDDNNKWIVCRGDTHYIFIFNENGTFSDMTDDKTLYVNSFVDQKGHKLRISELLGITQDLDGNKWISTNRGVYVVYKTNDVFTDKFFLSRVLVQRSNDGIQTTLAEGAIVNKVSVDGLNRKWIATNDYGVYLVNSQNSKVLHHFTKENSPLPSNTVLSVAFDDIVGVAYFGTDRGIVTYAIGDSGDLDDVIGVSVSPNPVSFNYTDDIIIRECKPGTVVKITNEANVTVSQGIADDGMYRWNMLDLKGQRMRPGNYFIYGVDASGDFGKLKVLKITN